MVFVGPISGWEAVPTALDDLWCPLAEFVAGCAEGEVTLLIEGGSRPSEPTFEGERHFLLRFSSVEMISGYAESLYCIFVRPSDPSAARVGTTIQRAISSAALDQALEIRRGPLAYFAVLTGGMHCEVIAAPDFELQQYESRGDALLAAHDGSSAKTRNLDAAMPEALEFLRSFQKRQ